MPYFIFLEFIDKEVSSFLNELRLAFHPKGKKSQIHVTLRGPYDIQPDPENVREMSNKLRGHGVHIYGAGKFATPNGFAVFIRAESAPFKRIWWKPDYPSHGKQIEPHITVYETSSRKKADTVLRFLRDAQISIKTYDVDLSIYTSGQGELFGPAIIAHEKVRNKPRASSIKMTKEVLIKARTLGAKITNEEAKT